jgi:glycosyltransferase involved in cell wall biosynthesis
MSAGPAGAPPAISVVMPAYNAAGYVREALDSMLAQTFRDFELIVVDDASTDATPEILAEYARADPRVQVLRNSTNGKIAKSLNRGIEAAAGRYVARMDADDWSYPDRLEKQFAYMESHPRVVLCGGTIEICDAGLAPINKRRYPLTNVEIRSRMFFFTPFCHPAVICRSDALRIAGGYNESFEVAQDYDLYFRIGRLGEFGNLDDCIHRLRTHPGSSSLRRGALQERNTLYIRLKAMIEYGYEMNRTARLYLVLQYLSSLLIPARIKFWLFNLLRRSG